MTGRQIVVWAYGYTPGKIPDGRLHCLWDHCTEGEHRSSLLAYVERHGDRLRNRYLQWVEDLADTDCRGISLVDQLELRTGLSYWWMTRAAERSPWRSDSNATVLRLMALEEMAVAGRIEECEDEADDGWVAPRTNPRRFRSA